MSDELNDKLNSAMAEVHRLRGAMEMIGIYVDQGLVEPARLFIDRVLSMDLTSSAGESAV